MIRMFERKYEAADRRSVRIARSENGSYKVLFDGRVCAVASDAIEASNAAMKIARTIRVA